MAGSQLPVQCCEMSQRFPQILESAKLMWAKTLINTSAQLFCRCKHIEITTCTQHQLIQSEDDRLKVRNM